VQGYGFQQPQFKAGNNIVVVWPNISSGISYPIDSVVTDVYFIPLNSVLVPFVPQSEFELFPNPATDMLSWNLQDGSLPGRVRIFDTHGRLVHEYRKVRNCSVAALPRGVYFIELEIDSSIVRERFVKM
jgi:Secretion system C-terminal sorting domain